MRNQGLLVVFLFYSFLVVGQSYRYAIFSPENKKIMEFEWDDYRDFSENLAVVTLKGKSGYLNTEGKIVIPSNGELAYDEANDFNNGLAIVKKNEKYGVIDKLGNIVLPIQYDEVEFDTKGKFAKVGNYYKYALMTEKGKLLTPLKYSQIIIDDSPFPIATNESFNGDTWGYLNSEGVEIIKPQYEGAWAFQDHVAVVKKDGLMGLIDEKGNSILSPKYEAIERRFELITAYNGEKFGVLSIQGKELTPLIYNSIGTQLYGISDGMLAVEREGKWGFLNVQTWAEVVLEYDMVRHFSGGYAAVNKNGLMGFINKSGKPITALKYERVNDFSEGVAAVSLNGKWGYIDQSGKEVIPLIYEAAYEFEQGVASVQVGEAWKAINKQNQFVPEKVIATPSDKSYHIKQIDETGFCTFVYPRLNLKVEKYWDGFGDAHDGKLTDLSSQQLVGENIVFDNGKIIKGDFYGAGKKVTIEDVRGIALENIREKIKEKTTEPPKQKTKEEIVAANNAYIRDLEELAQLYEKRDKLRSDLLISDWDFLDTPEQRKAKEIARKKPYIEVLTKIDEKIAYLLNHPETDSEYRVNLLETQKTNKEELLKAQSDR